MKRLALIVATVCAAATYCIGASLESGEAAWVQAKRAPGIDADYFKRVAGEGK